SYLGTPYRYGGNTRDGLDCSGLVCQVYRKHGMDLPRTSFHQYRQGRPVDRSDLQPGDLVFFSGSGGGVQHVGIYVGENRFLHASTHHRQVRIDSLSQRYFREHYLGARDLLGRPVAR
ncbi:MAG: C40 family peptidase, partial [Gemmatimonadetes bacterium]|nr:C40 family peptidase [Gemmatimonadota bacterium]